MSENNVMAKIELLPPEEAQPRMHDDDIDMLISRKYHGSQVKERLTSLNPKRRTAYRDGESHIRLCDEEGKWRTYPIEIRSISGNIMESIALDVNECLATFPRKWNEDKKEDELDFTSQEGSEARKRLIKLQNRMAIEKVLYGAMIEILDDDENVIWDARKGITQNIDRAINQLWKMGIGFPDIKIIADDIDKLDDQSKQDEVEEFKKKSDQL